MLNFLKNNVRGGICHCAVKKASANNAFCANYDKPSNYIMYLDATNLYGYSMF